jgi:hypothetical protein
MGKLVITSNATNMNKCVWSLLQGQLLFAVGSRARSVDGTSQDLDMYMRMGSSAWSSNSSCRSSSDEPIGIATALFSMATYVLVFCEGSLDCIIAPCVLLAPLFTPSHRISCIIWVAGARCDSR